MGVVIVTNPKPDLQHGFGLRTAGEGALEPVETIVF